MHTTLNLEVIDLFLSYIILKFLLHRLTPPLMDRSVNKPHLVLSLWEPVTRFEKSSICMARECECDKSIKSNCGECGFGRQCKQGLFGLARFRVLIPPFPTSSLQLEPLLLDFPIWTPSHGAPDPDDGPFL